MAFSDEYYLVFNMLSRSVLMIMFNDEWLHIILWVHFSLNIPALLSLYAREKIKGIKMF